MSPAAIILRLILFKLSILKLTISFAPTGQPFNPLGLLTAIAGIYGVSQAGYQVTKKVKSKIATRKGNNGTG